MTDYNRATELLRTLWDEIDEAYAAYQGAVDSYQTKVKELGVRTCHSCNKPMPDYDPSMECDGCNLPWGWATPKGRRELRAAELDAQLEKLRKEREALGDV